MAEVLAGALRDIPDNECKILLAFCGHTDSDFRLHLSMKTLSQETGKSDRWCRVLVRRLKARGKLHIDQGGGHGLANAYQIFPLKHGSTSRTTPPKASAKSAQRSSPTPTNAQRTAAGNDGTRRAVRIDRQQRTYAAALDSAMDDERQAINNRWTDFADFLNAVGEEAATQLLEHTKSPGRVSINRPPGEVAVALAALADDETDKAGRIAKPGRMT